MSLIKKVVAVKEVKERVARKTSDFSLTKSMRSGAVRDMFQVSSKKFEELALDSHSIVFSDSPLALVVVKEDSELAIALFSKRETAKSKSADFASPEFVKVLVDANIVPADRQEGFKASFSLKAIDQNAPEYQQMLADAEQLASDIVGVYSINFEEITTITKKARKPKEEVASVEGESITETPIPTANAVEDGDEVPAGAFASSLDQLDDDNS